MRTAVLFFGLVQRSLRHVIVDLRRNLIAPLEERSGVSIFYHSWITAELMNPRAEELGISADPGDIANWLPEARGILAPEAPAEAAIDWPAIERNNPMRWHCNSADAAQVAIRNAILTLQSLEAVFDLFMSEADNKVDCVVCSRADLGFIQRFELPGSLPENVVFLPKFHSWGGFNDRFAFGSPVAMARYAYRKAFFDGWMLNPNDKNPEWVLMKWLEREGLEVRQIPFVFQRIRAGGSVFHLDRELLVMNGG